MEVDREERAKVELGKRSEGGSVLYGEALCAAQGNLQGKASSGRAQSSSVQSIMDLEQHSITRNGS